MKFDYPYLGTQLLITAVGHSITQQPLQMSTVAVNSALGWNCAPLLCRTSEMAAGRPYRGNELGQG